MYYCNNCKTGNLTIEIIEEEYYYTCSCGRKEKIIPEKKMCSCGEEYLQYNWNIPSGCSKCKKSFVD